MKLPATLFCAAGACVAAIVGHGSAATAADSTTDPCFDFPRWHDSYGYRCEHYRDSAYCTPDGETGAGWESEWGTLAEWKAEGSVDAAQACCACGGGKQRKPKPPASPDKKGRISAAMKKKHNNKPPADGGVPKPGAKMSNKEWRNKYDPGWTYAGRVPALPPRTAPHDLIAKGGTMLCHMTEAQRRATDPNTPFFVHIAKTGGRALLRYLQTVLGDKYCEDWLYLHVNPRFSPPPRGGTGRLDQACTDTMLDYMAHLRTFTVIRDPLERLVSELGHSRVLPKVKEQFGTLAVHFEQLYETRWYANFQTGVLAGLRACNGDAVVGREHLEAVKQLIRDGKLLVATTEDMEASLVPLFDSLGRGMPEAIKTPFAELQKSPKSNPPPDLVQQLRSGSTKEMAATFAKFRQANALDYELYEFVQAHLRAARGGGEL